jgi:hypothetical protein
VEALDIGADGSEEARDGITVGWLDVIAALKFTGTDRMSETGSRAVKRAMHSPDVALRGRGRRIRLDGGRPCEDGGGDGSSNEELGEHCGGLWWIECERSGYRWVTG